MATLKIFLRCLELLEFFASSLGTIAFCLSLAACLEWQTGNTLLPIALSSVLLVVLLTERQELEF